LNLINSAMMDNLDCFVFKDIPNNAAMNIFTYFSWFKCTHILGHFYKCKNLGSYGKVKI
jgi:hypothetical protein